MARHAPSHRRELLRRFKQGEPARALLKEATTITEPGHAAVTLLTIAADERIDEERARGALQQARQLIDQLDRPARIAEAWAETLRILADWRPGQLQAAKDKFPEGLVRALERMPDGEWKRDVIVACAPVLPPAIQAKVMHHALTNQGFELPSSKAVWDHGEQARLRPLLQRFSEIAPRLLARAGDREAIDAAWALPDRSARMEALRILVWQAEDVDGLQELADSGAGNAPEDQAQMLTMVGAREDRLGIGDPGARWDAAAQALAAAPEYMRGKLGRKLEEARRRAGSSASPVEEAAGPGGQGPPSDLTEGSGPEPHPPVSNHQKPPQPEGSDPEPPHAVGGGPEPLVDKPADRAIPIEAGRRHVLALVDGYSGGLGNVHLRAIARAAPLCTAFDLDLVLVGFPIDDLTKLVDLVESDTQIGEGGKYVEALFGDGRLRLLPLHGGLPSSWPGYPVATTPDVSQSVSLHEVPAPICLLVGLGRQGIPRRILHAAVQHELTGQGISLETATAMGILADRLGRVPLP